MLRAPAPVRERASDTADAPASSPMLRLTIEDPIMAKSQSRSNKEVRKPKAEKPKTIAANASTKDKPVGIVTLKS